MDLPDVASEMLTTTEDHTTIAITSALESLSRSRTVAFCYVCVPGRRIGWWELRRGGRCDHVLKGRLVVVAVLMIVERDVVVDWEWIREREVVVHG